MANWFKYCWKKKKSMGFSFNKMVIHERRELIGKWVGQAELRIEKY